MSDQGIAWSWEGADDPNVAAGRLTLHKPDGWIVLSMPTFTAARALVDLIDARAEEAFKRGQQSIARGVWKILREHSQ